MNDLRVAMRKENHHLTNIANSVTLRIGHDEETDQWYLIAEPADDQFVEALRDAGIEVSEPEPVLEQAAPEEDSAIADYISGRDD